MKQQLIEEQEKQKVLETLQIPKNDYWKDFMLTVYFYVYAVLLITMFYLVCSFIYKEYIKYKLYCEVGVIYYLDSYILQIK